MKYTVLESQGELTVFGDSGVMLQTDDRDVIDALSKHFTELKHAPQAGELWRFTYLSGEVENAMCISQEGGRAWVFEDGEVVLDIHSGVKGEKLF